jgi:hypothetical protein
MNKNQKLKLDGNIKVFATEDRKKCNFDPLRHTSKGKERIP